MRAVEIPRGPIVELMEQQLRRPLTNEHRHYLADQPVNCGGILEVFHDGLWIRGRYEWTGELNELPTFESAQITLRIDDSLLLRWPK